MVHQYEGYNYDELNKYYNTRNYNGAIEYLNQFDFKDEDAITVRKEIDNLKRSAAINESIKNKLIGEDAEAYNFFESLSSGYIDRTRKGKYADGQEFETRNSYGDEYLKNLNSITTDDGKSIDSFAIDIDNTKSYDKFINALGDDLTSLGIQSVNIDNTKKRLIISKDNGNLYKMMNALDEIQGQELRSAAIIGAGTGALLFSIAGAFVSFGVGAAPAGIEGAAAGTAAGTALGKMFTDYHLKAISNNKIYDDFEEGKLKDAVNIANKAKSKYDNIQNTTLNQDVPSQLSVTGFISLEQANAAKARDRGKIKNEDYNTITKAWTDYMENLVSNTSFATSDKKVYAWGQEDDSTDGGEIKTGIMLERVKNTDAENLKTEILLAMKENRCNIVTATKDGKLGTKFAITPNKDRNKSTMDTFGNRKLEVFIEGLYSSSAQNLYDADTKSKAAQQAADMRKIGYEMSVADNTYIGYEQGQPYLKQLDKNTGEYNVVRISEQDALTELNKSFIIDRGIDEIINNFNKSTGLIDIEQRRTSVGAINSSTKTVKDVVNQIADDAIDELYPKGSNSVEDRKWYHIKIAQSIWEKLPAYIRKNVK